MINEQELKQFFAENKSEISDSGFSEQVQKRLPLRKPVFTQLIIPICIVAGLFLSGFMVGFSTIQTQLLSLIDAVVHLQIPPVSSIMTYLGVLATLGFVGFVVADTDIA